MRPRSPGVRVHGEHGADRTGDHVSVAERHDLGRAGGASRRQQRDDAIGRSDLGGVARVRGRESFVVASDAAVHRQHDDALQARRRRLQSLDLFVEAAGSPGRRGEQDLGFDRVDLRQDRLAAEQQVERLHNRRTHRGPIEDRCRRAIRSKHGNDIAGPDALTAQPKRRPVQEALKFARACDDRRRIQRGAKKDQGFRVGILAQSAPNEAADVGALGEYGTRLRAQLGSLLGGIGDSHDVPPSALFWSAPLDRPTPAALRQADDSIADDSIAPLSPSRRAPDSQ